jgi:hypothetical protein
MGKKSLFGRLRVESSAAFADRNAAKSPKPASGMVQVGEYYTGGLRSRKDIGKKAVLGSSLVTDHAGRSPAGSTTNNFQAVEEDRSLTLFSAEHAGFTLTHEFMVDTRESVVRPELFLDVFPPDRERVMAAAGWRLFCGSPPNEAFAQAIDDVWQEKQQAETADAAVLLDREQAAIVEAERQLKMDEMRIAAAWTENSHPYLLEDDALSHRNAVDGNFSFVANRELKKVWPSDAIWSRERWSAGDRKAVDESRRTSAANFVLSAHDATIRAAIRKILNGAADQKRLTGADKIPPEAADVFTRLARQWCSTQAKLAASGSSSGIAE